MDELLLFEELGVALGVGFTGSDSRELALPVESRGRLCCFSEVDEAFDDRLLFVAVIGVTDSSLFGDSLTTETSFETIQEVSGVSGTSSTIEVFGFTAGPVELLRRTGRAASFLIFSSNVPKLRFLVGAMGERGGSAGVLFRAGFGGFDVPGDVGD